MKKLITVAVLLLIGSSLSSAKDYKLGLTYYADQENNLGFVYNPTLKITVRPAINFSKVYSYREISDSH